MRRLFAAISVIMLISGSAVGCGLSGQSTQRPTAAQSAGQWVQTDYLGQFKTVDLSGNAYDYTMLHNNKLTMVNVWMTWCGYCVQEMPELAKLSGEYADKGFAVVGILGDSVKAYGDNPVRDDAAVALGQQIIGQSGVKYSNLQPDGVLSKMLANVDGYPTTYFLDSSGALVAKVVGANSYDGWKSKIEELLSKVN